MKMDVLALTIRPVALAPQDATTTSEVERAGAATSTLPDPASELGASGDMGATIAALIIRCAREQKRAHRELERTAESAESREDAAQVAAMHDKADAIERQAWANGLGDVASGAASVGAGASQMPGGRIDAQSSQARSGDGRSRVLSGSAEGSKGVATILGGAFGKATENDEASATMHGHAADHFKRALDGAHDGVKDANELLKDAVSFYREYANAQAQAKSAVLHRS